MSSCDQRFSNEIAVTLININSGYYIQDNNMSRIKWNKSIQYMN